MKKNNLWISSLQLRRKSQSRRMTGKRNCWKSRLACRNSRSRMLQQDPVIAATAQPQQHTSRLQCSITRSCPLRHSHKRPPPPPPRLAPLPPRPILLRAAPYTKNDYKTPSPCLNTASRIRPSSKPCPPSSPKPSPSTKSCGLPSRKT